jgi:hypothetical protein
MDRQEIYEILKEKGVTHLYHANTVRTSKSFLEHNALLSREFLEFNELDQTPQKSDSNDKKFGIWDCIFLDTQNQSDYFKKKNVYGPILFKINLDVLHSDCIQSLKLTKTNPCYWNDKTELSSFYYTSTTEFEADFRTGNKLREAGIMLVASCVNGLLNFGNHLEEILIDDPELQVMQNNESISIVSAIVQHYKKAFEEMGLKQGQVKIRKAKWLKSQYDNLKLNEIKHLFFRNDSFKKE